MMNKLEYSVSGFFMANARDNINIFVVFGKGSSLFSVSFFLYVCFFSFFLGRVVEFFVKVNCN